MADEPRIRTGPAQALGALVLLAGCGGAPSGPEDCEGMAAGAARDECYAAVAPAVFREDVERGAEIARRIDDPLVRDFVYLQVTREVDPGSPRWCDLIQEQALAGRCRVLVSRPHLHRELLREQGLEPPPPPPGPPPGDAPGNPPPGPPPGGSR